MIKGKHEYVVTTYFGLSKIGQVDQKLQVFEDKGIENRMEP